MTIEQRWEIYWKEREKYLVEKFGEVDAADYEDERELFFESEQ